MEKLSNPKKTIEIIQKYQFGFQKKFGQNFLIDDHVLTKIMDGANVTKDDFVLEIGPGIGTMTQYLAERARQVLAVEIDTKLLPILEETLAPYDNVEVLNNDILKVDMNEIANKYNNGKHLRPSHNGKRGRGTDKAKVVVAVSKAENGVPLFARMKVVEDIKGKTLQQIVNEYFADKTRVECDGYRSYRGLDGVPVELQHLRSR